MTAQPITIIDVAQVLISAGTLALAFRRAQREEKTAEPGDKKLVAKALDRIATVFETLVQHRAPPKSENGDVMGQTPQAYADDSEKIATPRITMHWAITPQHDANKDLAVLSMAYTAPHNQVFLPA